MPAPLPAPKRKIPKIRRGDLDEIIAENVRLREKVAQRAEPMKVTAPVSEEHQAPTGQLWANTYAGFIIKFLKEIDQLSRHFNL